MPYRACQPDALHRNFILFLFPSFYIPTKAKTDRQKEKTFIEFLKRNRDHEHNCDCECDNAK